MLTQVYVLLITQLPILIIHFINDLSYNGFIRYQVIHKLFPRICMAAIDYKCIKSVSEYSKFMGLLLK